MNILGISDESFSLILLFIGKGNIDAACRKLSVLCSEVQQFITREDIGRILCFEEWNLDANQFNEEWAHIKSWWIMFRILQQWRPLEGFYICANAYPWGLLLLLKLRQGMFIGEILKGGERNSKHTQVFKVQFSSNGAYEIIVCDSRGMIETGPCPLPNELPLDWSFNVDFTNEAANKLFVSSNGLNVNKIASKSCCEKLSGVYEHNSTQSQVRVHGDIWVDWHPGAEGNSKAMFGALLDYFPIGIRLFRPEYPTIRMKELPLRSDSFPQLKQGIYVRDYGANYGQHRYENLLVEFKKYSLKQTDFEGEAQGVWGEIWEVVFGRLVDQGTDSTVEGPRHCSFLNQMRDLLRISLTNTIGTNPEEVIFCVATKLTGDVHVPCGAISWAALVSHPVPGFVSKSSLRNHHPVVGAEEEEEEKDLPIVRAWFGWAMLAVSGFMNPTWTSGQLCQFVTPSQGLLPKSPSQEQQQPQFAFLVDRVNTDSDTILRWLPAQDSDCELK